MRPPCATTVASPFRVARATAATGAAAVSVALIAAVCLGVAFFAVGLVAPAHAFAAADRHWVEGTSDQPLSIDTAVRALTGTVRSKPGGVLERSVTWEYTRPGDDPYEPFCVEALPNGNVLIASRTNEVLEVDRQKRVVWSYTRLADNPDLVNVYAAQLIDDGSGKKTVLITDRRADFVIEVDYETKEVVWRYGVERDSLAPGSLVDPFSAVRLANGNTLITDTRGATRVLEIRSSDYDPDAPSLGYTEDSIVWRYGRDDDAGTGPGRLAAPRFARRLANGNTLISDANDREYQGDRVIEVDREGNIVWQFGEAGVPGSDETHINTPSAAIRLTNGNTLILEEEGRLLEVEPSGRILDWYGNGEMIAEGGEISQGRALDRTPSGTTLIGEQSTERVFEIGYPSSGTLTSKDLSLGLPGVKKTIDRIEVIAEKPQGTSISLEYSLDGGDWVMAEGDSADLPTGTIARRVRYRVMLHTPSAAYTPIVREVRIDYDVAPTDTEDPNGGTNDDATDDDDHGGTSSPETPAGAESSDTTGTGGSATTTGTGTAKVTPLRKSGGGLSPFSAAGGAGVLPGSGVGGTGADGSTFARGTLLDVLPLTGPAGVGFGALGGDGTGPNAVALGLLLVGLAYVTGVAGAPAHAAARGIFSSARIRLGRSSA